MKFNKILELGFACGKSSAYIAAALQECKDPSIGKKLVSHLIIR